MAKGFGGMGGFMQEAQKQAQTMQKQLQQLDSNLKERVVEGSSGGGMVVAMVNGKRELLAVKIAPEVVDPDDLGMLEDLVTAAVSQGLKKAEDLYQEEVAKITGGLHLPGLF